MIILEVGIGYWQKGHIFATVVAFIASKKVFGEIFRYSPPFGAVGSVKGDGILSGFLLSLGMKLGIFGGLLLNRALCHPSFYIGRCLLRLFFYRG